MSESSSCVSVCLRVLLPVLVLLVLLLFDACGSKSLAGQSGFHVLDLPRPQLPDGWTDESSLVQIHGSIQLHAKHKNRQAQNRTWDEYKCAVTAGHLTESESFGLLIWGTCHSYICILEWVHHKNLLLKGHRLVLSVSTGRSISRTAAFLGQNTSHSEDFFQMPSVITPAKQGQQGIASQAGADFIQCGLTNTHTAVK